MVPAGWADSPERRAPGLRPAVTRRGGCPLACRPLSRRGYRAYAPRVIPPPLSPVNPRHGIAFSRERDARICWLLGAHPVTAAMLVSLGWFPNRGKALKRLRRLAARRRIRFVGTVSRKSGRPEHAYCRWRVKPDQLLHEVELTEVCFRLDAGRILRGPHVTDQQVRPDAEVWINGQLYYLELDRGTMGYAQIERRFRLYEGCPHLALWVCGSAERLEGLRSRAGRIRQTALFATLADAMAAPHAEVWRDHGGQTAALPREVRDRVPDSV